jgi:hypothetical protein
VTDPVLVPLHDAFVALLLANANANGWVIVTFVEEVQLLASVTVTVYAPATKPVAIAAVPPDGDHK